MKPAKLLKGLAGTCAILLLLWLVYLYQKIPHRKAPFTKAVGEAQSLDLQRGTARLHFNKAGDHWSVSLGSGTALPADGDKVKTLLDGLKAVQLDDAISDRADRAAAFEVSAESGTRVTLKKSARLLAEGTFGKQAPDFSHIYFKWPYSPQVYLARGLLVSELGGMDFSGWRDHQLIDIADAQIQRISIENAGAKVALERSSDSWTMNGQAVDPAPVYGLVGQLAHLKADDFVVPGSTPAVDATQLTWATVTVQGAGQAVALRIGREDKTRQRFPATTGADTLVWLAESKVQSFLLKPEAFHPKK